MDEHTTPTDDGTPSFARSLSTGLEVRPTERWRRVGRIVSILISGRIGRHLLTELSLRL